MTVRKRNSPRPRGRYVLTDEQPYSRHPDAAAVQLYCCATPLSGGVAQPHSSQILPTACSKPAPGSLSKCCGFVWYFIGCTEKKWCVAKRHSLYHRVCAAVARHNVCVTSSLICLSASPVSRRPTECACTTFSRAARARTSRKSFETSHAASFKACIHSSRSANEGVACQRGARVCNRLGPRPPSLQVRTGPRQRVTKAAASSTYVCMCTWRAHGISSAEASSLCVCIVCASACASTLCTCASTLCTCTNSVVARSWLLMKCGFTVTVKEYGCSREEGGVLLSLAP